MLLGEVHMDACAVLFCCCLCCLGGMLVNQSEVPEMEFATSGLDCFSTLATVLQQDLFAELPLCACVFCIPVLMGGVLAGADSHIPDINK